MKFKKIILFIFISLVMVYGISSLFAQECKEVYKNGKNNLSIATGSPGEIGFLKVLGDIFGKEMDTSICWVKAGSGDALMLLKQKKVDMVIVHAPKAEKKAVEGGWATKRTLIGSNEFYIVGPVEDPAKISEARNAQDAYTRIAKAKAKFISRGDNSGTHKKEMEIWKKTGSLPSGEWYIVTKDFMRGTLKRATDEKGYFMTDSSTWVAEKKNLPNLRVLFIGDKFLVNTYHALCQPIGSTAGALLAAKFTDFLVSERGQRIIREFGKEQYGEGLYNDAHYASKYSD
jgi:tungstate transport system substrate-binding protein